MSKLNSKEKKQKKQLVNELKKSPTLAYLASELDKINDMVDYRSGNVEKIPKDEMKKIILNSGLLN